LGLFLFVIEACSQAVAIQGAGKFPACPEDMAFCDEGVAVYPGSMDAGDPAHGFSMELGVGVDFLSQDLPVQGVACWFLAVLSELVHGVMVLADRKQNVEAF
jgi:hypothetical protein